MPPAAVVATTGKSLGSYPKPWQLISMELEEALLLNIENVNCQTII